MTLLLFVASNVLLSSPLLATKVVALVGAAGGRADS